MVTLLSICTAGAMPCTLTVCVSVRMVSLLSVYTAGAMHTGSVCVSVRMVTLLSVYTAGAMNTDSVCQLGWSHCCLFTQPVP